MRRRRRKRRRGRHLSRCRKGRKVRYGTRERAEEAADELSPVYRCRYRVYDCDLCGGFHLTTG